jgi:hypothetical protein
VLLKNIARNSPEDQLKSYSNEIKAQIISWQTLPYFWKVLESSAWDGCGSSKPSRHSGHWIKELRNKISIWEKLKRHATPWNTSW